MITIPNIKFPTYDKIVECQNFLYELISGICPSNNYYCCFEDYVDSYEHLENYGFNIMVDPQLKNDLKNVFIITLLNDDPEVKLLIELKYA